MTDGGMGAILTGDRVSISRAQENGLEADVVVNDIAAARRQKRPRGFVLMPVRNTAQKIPRASAFNISGAVLPAPHAVVNRLGKPSIIVGFDCETHNWLDGTTRKGRIGPFGWYTTNDNVSYARVVQIGWVVGNAEGDQHELIKNALIQPHGYEISDRACAFHGISQQHAMENGRTLTDALTEFMRDVSQAVSCGGRVCAHQLEFDAGVIAEELQRCGLDDLRTEWIRIAKSGYCTMNPDAGRWVLQSAGQDVGPETKQHTLGLVRMLRLLGVWRDSDHNRHHNAAHDARMTRLIYVAMLARLQSSDEGSPISSSVETGTTHVCSGDACVS